MADNAKTRVAKLQSAAARLYEDFQVVLAEHKEVPWADGEARIDDAFDVIDEVLDRLKGDVCEGHPAGPFDPMGQTVYCDGTCTA